MRKQQPGMTPYLGNHQNSKEMQLLQQHLMYKQMQELQRQQHLQQQDQGARQQNFLGQAAARQAVSNQLPSLLNGMPIRDASSCMLPNDTVGGGSRALSSSQLLTADITNWAPGVGSSGTHGPNRLMVINDHVQTMRPVGFIPEQLDQSLYGTPVSSNRGLWNQFPQFQGMSNDFTAVMAKAVRDQSEKASANPIPSSSFQKDRRAPEQVCLQDGLSVAAQRFQGDGSFANAPVQDLGAGTSENFQELNHPQQNIQAHVFQNRQEQAWSSNIEQKAAKQVGPPRVTSLDPTEEKILFGSEDDGNWSAPFGRVNNMEGHLHGDSFASSDQLGAFPSLQSGSWSALMQEAVQASSSDKGLQEEWSGLSFQRREQSIGNLSSIHNDVLKHQLSWDNNSNSFQSASSAISGSSPLFNDANSGPSFSHDPSFQHSTAITYVENNRVQTDASHESFQRSSVDDVDMHIDQSHKQTQVLDSGLQAQNQSNNVPHGIWQSTKSADLRNMEFNLQSSQGTWTRQGHIPLSDISRHPQANPSGWNKSLETYRGSMSGGPHNSRTIYAQNGGNSSSGVEQVNYDISSSHMQSAALSRSKFAASMDSNNLKANQEMNQYPANRHQLDFRKHDAFDSSVKSRGENMADYKHQSSKGQQVQESSVNSADPSPSMSDSQTSSGMSGWKTVGSRRFQSHSTENLGMMVEPAESPNDTGYSQGTPKLLTQQSKYQEQGYMENSMLAGPGLSNMGKGHSIDMQRCNSSPEQSQYRNTTRHTSRNMLELLHKVDGSRDNSSATCSGNSDHNAEVGAAGRSVSHPHSHEASGFPGFGLPLTSPSHGQQLPNNDLHTKTSLHDSSRRQLESVAGYKHSASTGLDHSLHHALESSQNGNLDGRSNSGQMFKDMSQLIDQGNTSAISASHLSYMGRQMQLQRQQQLLQQQHISGLTGREAINGSGNLASRSQAALEEQGHHASLLRRAQISHDVALASHSGQQSLPSMAGRTLPFRIDPSSGAHRPSSEVHPTHKGQSPSTNAGLYNLKNNVQQAETGAFLQASARSGISQQIGFSSMLQNVWTNAAAQKVMSSSQPQTLTPNIPQSVVLSASGGNKSPGTVLMEDVQGNERGSVPFEHATCSSNSQQFIDAGKDQAEEDSLRGTDSERGNDTPKTGGAPQGQEQLPKHQLDGKSAFSVSSVGHLPHYDVNRGKPWPNAAASDIEAGLRERTVLLTNTQHPSYSLLQQMQAMKAADSDASIRDGKRLKGESSPSASQTEWQAGQGYTYGQTAVPKVPLPAELGPSSNSAFPSNVKMLSFSSREGEEKDAHGSTPLVGTDGLSLNAGLSGQPDLHNQAQYLTSTPHFVGRSEHPLLTPQMTRSWFEQYRKYKNGQILAMYAHQKIAQASSQQFPVDVSSKNDNAVLSEQRIETNQFSALSQSMPSSNRTTVESSHQLPFVVTGHDVVIGSKKRKTATSDLLPWHQVVSCGVERLQSISMAECGWAQAANRLTEKAENITETIEDGSVIPQGRKRLILTTQLMQHLFNHPPAPILAAEVTSSHEIVAYFLAKSTLGDACSQISSSRNDAGDCLDKENRSREHGTCRTIEKSSEDIFLKVAENFTERSRKLESEFSRLDKRTSILDVRIEWQEVEKFSLINRLGKFHGRSQADGAESSSASQSAPRKIFPQRYVTAFSMPGNVPEGVHCLSL